MTAVGKSARPMGQNGQETMSKALHLPANRGTEPAKRQRRRPGKKIKRTLLQVEAAVKGLRQDGVPLELLSNSQIAELSREWLADKKIKPTWLPSVSSCLRHLPGILNRVDDAVERSPDME